MGKRQSRECCRVWPGEKESRSKKKEASVTYPRLYRGSNYPDPQSSSTALPIIAYANAPITFLTTFPMGFFFNHPPFFGPLASSCAPPSAISASSAAGAVVVATSFSLPIALSFPLLFPNKGERVLNFSLAVRLRAGAISTKNTD
ncbi:hypothetical protein B9Z19DRAFT_1090587 [Tuber borchii]|uniref:Uncharacterized protein n=1 Tax=Tuber borchii TaxID=42251 RepID=A0A2T6ZIQ2_TUBBO|nr:hypothetical protein B9Z19DRAFT_1090587 [Tuber borchii]